MRLSAVIGLGLLGGCLSLPACGGGDDDDGDGSGGSSAGKGGSAGSSAGKGGSAGSSAGKGGSAGSSAGKGGSAGSSAGKGGSAGAEGGAAGSDAGGAAGADTGEAGSANAGAGGAPSAGGAGEGGVPASGGTPGEGGAGGDASGGLVSVDCADLPADLTLGTALELDSFGAVLCSAATAECRITTNTFSDGPNPCDFADNVGFFKELDGDRSLRLSNSWTFASATAGTIDGTETYLGEIPVDTEITAVITSPEATDYTVVFEFGAGQALTVTSITENT